ncbi:hypothetical protein ACFQPA_11370 [Halomarina halobia]|uniref:Uncharacterized protein n=1 Tax=Halomarina halobia TaxID=3033386 RepID=A0ABD6AAV4_9EURY|nr:hypothetical protein [Halomarina sp. PSR21]
MTDRIAGDLPEYDGASYVIDAAREHAARGEWAAVSDLAHEALDRVRSTEYPHLFDRLHRQGTDVVLRLEREDPDYARIRERLEEMQETVEGMQELATDGRFTFSDD